jgi:hypothetical protein
MIVEVWGPNLGAETEQIHVHKPGCRDTTRGIYLRPQVDRPWSMDADSVEGVVKDVYPPNDFGYEPDAWEEYLGDIKVFPCVPLPHVSPND